MTREEQLDRVRSLQHSIVEATADERQSMRIILEFQAMPDPGAVADAIRQLLGIEVAVSPLMAAHGLTAGDPATDSLVRFLAVSVAGVSVQALPGSPFELAYAVGDAAGAVTAEPETHADFYRVPPERDADTESVDAFPPGCWVPGAEDPTPSMPYWALQNIGAPKAWDVAPTHGGKSKGEGISVFQPDTGVADHVEIEAGMLDLSRSHDFVSNKAGATDPMDYSGNPGHGTGTASVVASRLAGTMAGSAPLATLVPLRAVESVVVFDHGRVAAAVEYARRNGAQVITMSLGGPWSSALRAAIDAAIAEGVIVLAAAGNCVGLVVWPARYEEVIAVAGSNRADKPWKGTSRGSAVDISAPGEFVPRANRSPENGGSPTSVAGGQGTSFAVALTAGVAALWLAHHGVGKIKQALGPNETVQQRFVSLLRLTARLPGGFDTESFGAGIVDAKKLLTHSLMAAPQETLEAVTAKFDPLHSVRTALAEIPIAVASATEAVANPMLIAPVGDRRFAAELSHLALQASLQAQTNDGGMESLLPALPPSPTLLAVMAGSGSHPN